MAVIGGAMRIGGNSITWRANDPVLETYAASIDLLLIFALSALFFQYAARLGVVGLIGYIMSVSGLAIITGPDGVFHGFDIYQTGVVIIGAGLVFLSAALFMSGVARLAAFAWIGAALAQIAGWSLGAPVAGFLAAGVLFGLGFVFAGLTLLRH